MLKREPKLEAMTLFEYLQAYYPGQYQSVLRTVQRRVSEWKAQHGVAPEVMFELRHTPGEMGYSDFTELKTHIPHVSRETGHFLKLSCCNGFRKRYFSRLNLRLNYSTLLRKQLVPMTETLIASFEICCITF